MRGVPATDGGVPSLTPPQTISEPGGQTVPHCCIIDELVAGGMGVEIGVNKASE